MFEPTTPGTFMPDATGCPVGYAGRFSFEATLTNISGQSIAQSVIEISGLTPRNFVIGVDGGLLEERQAFSVPGQAGPTAPVLDPGEPHTVPFTVCLETASPFELFVNVRGTATD